MSTATTAIPTTTTYHNITTLQHSTDNNQPPQSTNINPTSPTTISTTSQPPPTTMQQPPAVPQPTASTPQPPPTTTTPQPPTVPPPISTKQPSTSTGTFTDASIDYGLKYVKFVRTSGTEVMRTVFLWMVSNKPPNTDLFQYMDNLPPNSVNYHTLPTRKLGLSKHQMKMILENPNGDEWDITTIFRCFQLAHKKDVTDRGWCTKGPLLKNLLYEIKQERNKIAHENLNFTKVDLEKMMKHLCQVLVKTLNEANNTFKKLTPSELNTIIHDVKNNCSKIMNDTISVDDMAIQLALKEMFISEVIRSLSSDMKNECNIHPMSFLPKKKTKLLVEEIFTMLKIKQDENQSEISYEDLLTVIRNKPDQPHLMVLSGLAGSGKTTLVKKVITEWLAGGNGSIKDLGQYQVLILVSCRDTRFTSFTQLLKAKILPNCNLKLLAASIDHKDLLSHLVKRCPILLIVDGYDEKNENSKDLVNDILAELKHVQKSTLLFTSRPEAVPELLGMVECDVTQMEIVGIPVEYRVKFATKYWKAIIKAETQTTPSARDRMEDIQKLEQIIEKEKQNDVYRIPLYLVILVWLFYYKPELLEKKLSQSQLLEEAHRLCQENLCERLASTIDRKDSKQNLKIWLPIFYEKAFEALSLDKLTLSNEAVQELKDKCKSLNVPEDEFLGAFLVIRPIYDTLGMVTEQHYSAPHKSLQDYYAANCIIKELNQQNGILQTIQKVEAKYQKVGENTETLLQRVPSLVHLHPQQKVDTKYQNLLQQVAGLLHLHLPASDPKLTAASQEVMKLLRQTGISSPDQWLDILEDTVATPATLEAISRYFPMTDVTITDNRMRDYVQLLPLLSPREVTVDITSDPTHLIKELRRHQCTLTIHNSNILAYTSALQQISKARLLVVVDDPSHLAHLNSFKQHTWIKLHLRLEWFKHQSTPPVPDHLMTQLLSR